MLIPYTSKIMQKVRSVFVLQKITLFGALIVFLGMGTLLSSHGVFAVRNNHDNKIPDSILDGLESRSQDVRTQYVNYYGKGNVPGPWCDGANTKFHFQVGWVSLENAPTLNKKVTIQQDEGSIKLQYNRVAGTCHRIFSNTSPAADSIINDTSSLHTTYTRILSSSARIQSGIGLNSGLASSGPIVLDNMNYNAAYDAKLRFVHPSSASKFTVSGLDDLAPGNYQVAIEVQYIMVNQFGASPGALRCVNGANVANNTQGIPAGNPANGGCKVSKTTMYIDLQIVPKYAASCEVTRINGVDVRGGKVTNLSPGESFNARFLIHNQGSEAWKLARSNPAVAENLFRLGSSAPRDNKNWGPQRVAIGTAPAPAAGAVMPANSSTEFTADFKVADTLVSGSYQFTWGIVHDGAGGGRGWIGSFCPASVFLKENRPYLQIAGGDVISGARFGSINLGTSSCIATSDAKNAAIKTNGYYGNPMSSFHGSSTSQYGVFASGAIGDDGNYENVNTFLGNFGYDSRDFTDGAKDALFASLNLDDDEYGNFYKGIPDPPLPCVDIRPLENGAIPLANSAAATAFLGSSESGVRSITTPNLEIAAGSATVQVPAGARKTLIVKGNVTIGGKITYGDSYASESAIPYLHIIADNIFIQASSASLDQRVDASLTAIPSKHPTDSDQQVGGIIDTCSNMGGAGPGVWPTSLTNGSCRRNPSLVLNGKLVARRILWKRTGGTLSYKNAAIDSTCYYANWETPADAPMITGIDTSVERMQKCSSELVKFNAEAYLGNFDDNVIIDSVPKNTLELPPIY